MCFVADANAFFDLLKGYDEMQVGPSWQSGNGYAGKWQVCQLS